MPSSGPAPTLSAVRSWDVTHLRTAASQWAKTAKVWEDTFTQLSQNVNNPGGTPWLGEAAEAAQERAYNDRLRVIRCADQLHAASSAARTGVDQIDTAKRNALTAVRNAEQAGFTVGEDFSVTYRGSASPAAMAAKQAQAQTLAADIRMRVGELIAADQQVAGKIIAATEGLGGATFADEDSHPDPTIQLVDNHIGGDVPATPPHVGERPDPRNPFVGDERFGHWEDFTVPPYTGKEPPPLRSEYRPFGPDTPGKNGGPTEWYVRGQNWVTDDQAPLAQYQEQYKFRISGQEATTFTRTINDEGGVRQQRWVQNVYEAQHNTKVVFGGEVPVKGRGGWTEGDIGGLPPIQNFGEWHRMAPNEIATISANNSAVKYYIPDGCGGQFTYEGGVPVGGWSGRPANQPPIMTAPR
ncbi:hypothetical protein MANY_22310 [Mycolicibacterium anyangense]|uniref:ESX-1 secretion-associated protein EspA/EspE-like domain-containing protein n=1 Tax=Mycolicibacterium anyangense TaxID=1431246 RepID=A0A6N4WA33_9MYCO|nr:hypothetical protein [Mycolicibacterium anyangense]BBZ76894.1 hypothetical protein MANY_22310 [Mycolicibacterium anyangense]